MKRERTESTIRHVLTGNQSIRNPIATIVVLTLAFLFLQGRTQAQTAPTPQEQACFNAVQGKVAHNQAGNKNWNEANLRKLCQYTTNPNTTIACFQREIQAHNSWEKGVAACKNDLVSYPSQTKMQGAARDIDAKNGQAWIIGTGAVGNDYEIYKLAGSSWTKVDGAARRIAVEKSGIPWVINSTGKIYRRVNNQWQLMPGPNGATPVDIAISNSDEVWITVDNGTVSRWTGSGWTTLIALNAKHVIFTPNPDKFLIVDNDGKKFVRESPTSWVFGKDTTGLADKYMEYAVELNGTRWGIDSSFNIWKLETVTGVEKPAVNNPKPVVTSKTTAEGERAITFKNEAGYVAKLTVTYFMTETIAGGAQVPMAKSLSTSAISLGFSKTLVIPRNTARGMPISVELEGSGTLKSKFFSTTVPEGFTGTLCFKCWGTIFDAKGGTCQ